MNTVERITIGEQISSWIDRFSHLDTEMVLKSHMTLSKLACKTGNLQLAKHHLEKAEQLQMEGHSATTYPVYPNSYTNGFVMPSTPMFVPQTFNHISPFSLPPGFAGVMPTLQLSPSLPPPLPLEMVLQAAKIARLTKSNRDNGTAFFSLGSAISAQDIAMCSPSVSPAPGMTKDNPEFLFRIEKARRAILKLGKWAN